jgi:very-short-patch-repair endonuclease
MSPRQRLARYPGTTPIKRARARELRRNATPAEQVLWSVLRNRQLAGCHFRRQHILAGFIVDFCCIKARLVVEVDGAQHNGPNEDDAHRTHVLNELGFEVLRFSNASVLNDLTHVLGTIGAACRSGWSRPTGTISHSHTL